MMTRLEQLMSEVGEVHRILRGLDVGTMAQPKMPELEFNNSATIGSG